MILRSCRRRLLLPFVTAVTPEATAGESGNKLGATAASKGSKSKKKLVLLGDSGVSKSCIVLRFVRGQFDPTFKVTIGAEHLSCLKQ